MKKLISISAAVLTFLFMLSILPTGAEGEIYRDTLRLRVIANSDSEEDQRVKLLVRDAILRYTEENYSHLSRKAKFIRFVLGIRAQKDFFIMRKKETYFY